MSSLILERVLKYVRTEEITPLAKPVIRDDTETPSI